MPLYASISDPTMGLAWVPSLKSVEPMLLLRTERLPEGSKRAYELKLGDYMALAIKTGGKVHLRSRNDNDFNLRYPAVVQALRALPDETVIGGEVVALDETRRHVVQHAAELWIGECASVLLRV
jgi:ATP-dependent DNA ligase